MRIATLLATTAIVLALVTSAAAGQTTMPNANQTAVPSPSGTMPNANQTPEATRDTDLPRADGTMAVVPAKTTGVPTSSPLCKPGAMTTNCSPIPNPSCLPGQATTPSGQQCPSPTVP